MKIENFFSLLTTDEAHKRQESNSHRLAASAHRPHGIRAAQAEGREPRAHKSNPVT